MRAEHINPFLNSTLNLFENMLGARPNVGMKSVLGHFHTHRWDVSGVIGVTGSYDGIIAIRMTDCLVSKLLDKSGIQCADELEASEMINSMVGEMANVIAGNSLGDIKAYDLDITVPIVVQGRNHMISWPHKAPVIAVPFASASGAFEVNVSLRENLVHCL